ncbi:MAG TPA: hypothetical protein VH063_06375 [Gaiellaceae bacterium]|jgi:hypothetical protein|nr:hypothetical protein [Gaiellaceae bacterium]
MEGSQADLGEVVAAQGEGRIELVVSTLSPDGRWAAGLLHVSETDHWLESVYELVDGAWREWTTSNEEQAWSPIRTKDGVSIGVFRLYGPAPPEAERALVSWRGELHEAPVQNGFFAFAAWDVSDEELIRTPPALSGFA